MNDTNSTVFNSFSAEQRKHYMDFKFSILVQHVGFHLLRITPRLITLAIETDEEETFPVMDVELLYPKTGLLSYLTIFPRYASSSPEDFIQEIKDLIVRFSITAEGHWFYTPCWTAIYTGKEQKLLNGWRVDWDELLGKQAIHTNKGTARKKFFEEVTSTNESYLNAVHQYLVWWINKGASHEDF